MVADHTGDRGAVVIGSSPSFGRIKRMASMVRSLNRLGYGRSLIAKAPVDADGHPLPWYTYPAIIWLGARLPKDARVFEYGAGHSTLWYAGHCASVHAVEHDADWVAALSPRLPANATVVHRTSGYVEAIDDADDPFDVIAVDGVQRVAAAAAAMDRLAANGIIVVDNSDRPSLAPILVAARRRGLQRIDFSGPVPGSGRLSTTTVLGVDLEPWLVAAPDLELLGYERDDGA